MKYNTLISVSKVILYLLSIIVITHSIIFLLLKFHLFEYFYYYGFDIHFNHAGFDKTILYCKYNSKEYGHIIVFISYITMIISTLLLITYLFFKKIKLEIFIILIFSIINIITIEPKGQLNTIMSYLKFEALDFRSEKLMKSEPMKNGIRKIYHQNGVLMSEVKVINGLFEGELKRYSSDGTLFEIINFKAGKPDGPQNSYHPNGKPLLIILNKDGKQLSLQHFNKNGQLMEIKTFLSSPKFPYGYTKNYHENGQLRFFAIFNKNKKVEYNIKYDENGKVISEYKRNKL